MSSTEFFCIKVVSPSARAGRPRREATRSPGKQKSFSGGPGPSFFWFCKMTAGKPKPEGPPSAFTHNQNSWSAVRQGAGDFGRSGAGTGGKEHTGEKRRRTKARWDSGRGK